MIKKLLIMYVYYLYSSLIPLRCFYNNEIMEEEIMYSKSSILIENITIANPKQETAKSFLALN